ncbi:MAG: hypothetical protein ABJA82_09910 [Myxococcales bacterium]
MGVLQRQQVGRKMDGRRALQEYGAFVGDYSGAVSLYAEASPEAQAVWGGGSLTNETAGKIPLNRFRVLKLGITYDNMN